MTDDVAQRLDVLEQKLDRIDRYHGDQLAVILDSLQNPPEAGGSKAAAVVEAVERMEKLLKELRDALSAADRVPDVPVAEPAPAVADSPGAVPAGLPPPWGTWNFVAANDHA